jgi:hypothetical protein
MGLVNHSLSGPAFGSGYILYISNYCDLGEYSSSSLGGSYGVNQYALFGQRMFRVVDYEVFGPVFGYGLCV